MRSFLLLPTRGMRRMGPPARNGRLRIFKKQGGARFGRLPGFARSVRPLPLVAMPAGFSQIAGKVAAEVTSPAVLEDVGFGRSVESILPEVIKSSQQVAKVSPVSWVKSFPTSGNDRAHFCAWYTAVPRLDVASSESRIPNLSPTSGGSATRGLWRLMCVGCWRSQM